MPSRDTKVITMRVPNEEYFKWLELAAKNRQAISTYMKSCINTHIGVLASNGIKLESPPVAKIDTTLVDKANKLEKQLEQKEDEINKLKRLLNENRDKVQKLYKDIRLKDSKIQELEVGIIEKNRLIEKLRDDIENSWDKYNTLVSSPIWNREKPTEWDNTIINGKSLNKIWQEQREQARNSNQKQFLMKLPSGYSIMFNTITGKSLTT
jgi:chromosome segregation ATPase